jgi:hypothetical protein
MSQSGVLYGYTHFEQSARRLKKWRSLANRVERSIRNSRSTGDASPHSSTVSPDSEQHRVRRGQTDGANLTSLASPGHGLLQPGERGSLSWTSEYPKRCVFQKDINSS